MSVSTDPAGKILTNRKFMEEILSWEVTWHALYLARILGGSGWWRTEWEPAWFCPGNTVNLSEGNSLDNDSLHWHCKYFEQEFGLKVSFTFLGNVLTVVGKSCISCLNVKISFPSWQLKLQIHTYFGNICSAAQKLGKKNIIHREPGGRIFKRNSGKTQHYVDVHVLTLFHLIFFVESKDCG